MQQFHNKKVMSHQSQYYFCVTYENSDIDCSSYMSTGKKVPPAHAQQVFNDLQCWLCIGGSDYLPRHSWPSPPIFQSIAICFLSVSHHFWCPFPSSLQESFVYLKVSFSPKIQIKVSFSMKIQIKLIHKSLTSLFLFYAMALPLVGWRWRWRWLMPLPLVGWRWQCPWRLPLQCWQSKRLQCLFHSMGGGCGGGPKGVAQATCD